MNQHAQLPKTKRIHTRENISKMSFSCVVQRHYSNLPEHVWDAFSHEFIKR